MKLVRTILVATIDLQNAVKRKFRRACEDLGVSLASVGHNLDRSSELAERWADERVHQHLPVDALASTTAFPEPLFERLVSDLRDLRHEQQRGLCPSPEGASALFLVRAGAAVEEIARALADGKVTALERPACLRKLAELEAQIASVRRSFEASEGRTVS